MYDDLLTSDFSYHLPPELIAQTPLADRAASRMLVLDRQSGAITHTAFAQLAGYLRPGDCLVFNDSRVIPARLMGADGGGRPVEVLLLHRADAAEYSGEAWVCLVKPGRRCRIGDELFFGDGLLSGTVTAIQSDGCRVITFDCGGPFEPLLERLGSMPLPPYITHTLTDPERYQTVYASPPGSAAAPTAGLHFTPEFIDGLRDGGAVTAFVTLHVGLGTFRPVKAERLTDHAMHSEYFSVSPDSAAAINTARAAGGRVIAVGTTVCRTLETAAAGSGQILPGSGWTDIFIAPGYNFKAVDGLLTNFHLPQSTLFMLVSAFAGREPVLVAYEAAVGERYRFYSFGDCMLVV